MKALTFQNTRGIIYIHTEVKTRKRHMDPIITVEANKDLTIKLEHQEERDELAEILEIDGTDQALSYLLEDEAVNGSYTAFDAGNGNPFVGLTEAPCIAESMDIDNNGKMTIQGEFWFYERYMLECPVQKLIEEGSVTFQSPPPIPQEQ